MKRATWIRTFLLGLALTGAMPAPMTPVAQEAVSSLT
jgi:uncharacterized protein YgfB (UPF0149 family)